MKDKNSKSYRIRTNLLGYERSDKVDPATLKFAGEYTIIDNVTAKLVHMGKDEDYQNDLAKVIRLSDDKLKVFIKIKKANFSDGTKITATDVAKSLKRGILKGTPHIDGKSLWVGAENLKSIDDEIPGIEVLSEDSIELRLTRPTKELFFFLTLIDMAVLHKSQYEKDVIKLSDWEGVTSGAYKVDFSESDGEKNYLKLVVNEKSHNYSNSIPKEVTFEGYKKDDVIERLKNNTLDLGVINFKDYLDNIDFIENVKAFNIYSNNTDGIVYMGLNYKSKLFKKDENRRWIQKKILESYKIEEKYERASQKATQFFLPNAKGFIPYAKVLDELKNVDTSKVPADLKKGFKIRSITGMKYWLPSNFEEKLSQTLGIPVEVELKESWKEMGKFNTERTFQATVMGYGMSYKVLGEALNLQYLSEAPPLLDPTGKIKKLIAKYQSKEDKKEEAEIIEQILSQMVNDSECIPLFYYSSPYFVKKSKLNAKNLYLDESIKFYKMAVK